MVKLALFKQNGSIEYKDFIFENDFIISDLEVLIENKGHNYLKIFEEGFLKNNKYYILIGYKNGNKFSQHEFESQNVFGDAIMLISSNLLLENLENLIDITENNVEEYTSYEILSSVSFSDSNSDYDEYDFTDGWLINDLI